jgi:DNA-binding beta-propeller fold protein YncE
MCSFFFGLVMVHSLLVAYGQEQYSYVRKWGSPGSGDGQFSEPTRIVIDSSDNVYVLDSGQNSVQKFSSNGTLISKWGSSGSSSGQFKNPTDIALDPVENIYILDMANPFVKKFSGDGTYMNSWGELVGKSNRYMAQFPGLGSLVEPAGVAIDPSGKLT